MKSPIAFFCALAALGWAARADLVNRWSFNNPAGSIAPGLTLTDSVSGATITVVGAGPTGANPATFTGAALRLPGSGATANPGTAAANVIFPYLDLPNGIVSSKTNLTVEIWATPFAALSNMRLVDFGRMSIAGVGGGAAGEVTNASTTAPGVTTATNVDDLALNISRGASLNAQRIEGRLNGAAAVVGDSDLAAPTNVENHYALTFEAGVGAFSATGGRASWWMNGVPARAIDVSFRLSNLEDVNNWLGRSQFSADALANVAYNEVRIYNHPLSAADLAASRAAGANPAAPVAMPDTITLNLGRKVSIAVRANDTGAVGLGIVSPPSFGTAAPDAFGRILYAHTSGSPASDSFTYRASNAAGSSAPALVTVNFSPNLRLTAPTLNVPATPPPAAYEVVDAFGNLAFSQPAVLATPPGETQRLFVGEKTGLLRVIPNVNASPSTAATFLNLPSLLLNRNLPAFPNEQFSSGGEQGLLGVAFHPSYATNGYFYVAYSVDKDSTAASPLFQRLSRFSVSTSSPNVADPNSELILLEQLDDASNHNGGDLHFGADGYLYHALGDEGAANDALNNSQRITKDFFSAILRIDVDKRPGNLEPNANPNPVDYPVSPPPDAVMRDSGIARYSIPIDNPFVHTSLGGTWNGTFNGAAIPVAELPYVRSEFWAVGLRNPWRISFDPPTGDLWCGDVGQGAREEIDIIKRGGNYGWAFREGMINGAKSAQAPANFDTLYGTRPIHDYQRLQGPTGGFSITGGFVYRGARLPELAGSYIYSDYVSGNIWSIRRVGMSTSTPALRLAGEGGIVSFAPDPSSGDVLMADIDNGRIRRLVGGVPASSFPTTLGATGVFADLADLGANPGLVSYEVNLPAWNDYGIARRWFAIPDALGTMGWSREDSWTSPTGQVWVQHLDLELTRGNPATRRRVETRVLVRNAGGAYGVSYRWNDTQTDATLAPDEGVNIPFTVMVGATPTPQTWRIPSRAECLACHTSPAGYALSATTRQLNLTGAMNGFAGNQLTVLHGAGYFSNPPEPPNVLPRHVRPGETAFSLAARARSYLAANCAGCHDTSGLAAPATWDASPDIPLAQTGLIHGAAANNGGDPLNKLIVPGDTAHSIVLSRMAASNGFTRMPQIGSNELDPTGIALLTQWIGSAELAGWQTYDQWRLAQFGSATSPEGDPTADADFDGEINAEEFLALTAPFDGSSFLRLVPGLVGGQVTVTLNLPANRIAQIETSLDLLTWTLWDVPGNQGLATSGGPLTLTGPLLGPKQFFRGKVRE
jgi:glucose/arabinose dehydrogenase